MNTTRRVDNGPIQPPRSQIERFGPFALIFGVPITAVLGMLGVVGQNNQPPRRPMVTSVEGAPKVQLEKTSLGYVATTQDPAVLDIRVVLPTPGITPNLDELNPSDTRWSDAGPLDRKDCMGIVVTTETSQLVGKVCVDPKTGTSSSTLTFSL